MSPSVTEEHYLKGLYLQAQRQAPVPLKALAMELEAQLPSVHEMVKRLAQKKWLIYQPYKGLQLTTLGEQHALRTLRNQRLWEVFLVEKLGFGWEEVHAATEELEHVRSETVMRRLEAFLGHPKVDPHGDPIPDADGQLRQVDAIPLVKLAAGQPAAMVGVRIYDPPFLQQLERLGLNIGVTLELIEVLPYDGSLLIRVGRADSLTIGRHIAEHVMVSLISSEATSG